VPPAARTRPAPPAEDPASRLPPRAAGALFHVVHDDGDAEDLELGEAEAALEAFAQKERDELLHPPVLAQPHYENRLERKALRIKPSALGLAGARDELLDFEEWLAPLLGRLGTGWVAAGRKDEGAQEVWQLSCRAATTVNELAELLGTLEEAVHALQTAAAPNERKPWRKEGHEYVGQQARRFFAGFGASDGRISGWLPAEGSDPPLWHMVHGDDNDEEDLDETEVRFAIANYAEERNEPTPEEAEYNLAWRTAAEAEAAAAAKAASEGGGGAAGVGGGSFAVGSRSRSAHRLWQSVESRERWRAALRQPHSPAVVALAIKALRDHCEHFGALGYHPPRGKEGAAAERDLAYSAWVHAGAFKSDKQKKKKH